MKSAIQILLVAIALAGASCTRGFVYRVFNNTGHDLVIRSYDTADSAKEYSIASGASCEVQFPTRLVITAKLLEWRYKLNPYESVYEYKRRAGFRVQDVQIQPDGTIYLLRAKSEGITSEFPPQPRGFPLQPR